MFIRTLSQKTFLFYIICITICIFIYWLILGYHSTFWIDPMKEMMGNVIQIKFPNNLWENIKNQSDPNIFLHKWHITRWSADFLPYISFQIVGKLYNFITKDPVTSIYIAQGTYISFYYTLLAIIITLYIKKILQFSITSYPLLFTFFISGMSISIFAPSYFLIPPNISILSHYLFPTILMLLSLYPYLSLFIDNRWNNKFNSLLFLSIWYIIIILSIFSSSAISFIFFTANAIIGLIIFYHLPQHKIIDKIKYLLCSPPVYVQSLYFSGIVYIISLYFEYKNGINIQYELLDTLQDINNKKMFVSNIPTFFQSIITYLKQYFIVCIPLLIQYFIKSSQQNQIKKISIIILYFIIITILYCLGFSVFREIVSFSHSLYTIPIKILLTLSLSIVIIYIFSEYKSPILYSLVFMIIFSRYLDNLPQYKAYNNHFIEYQYYKNLHIQNKSQTNNEIIISKLPIYSYDKYDKEIQFKELIQEFTRYVGIIDKDKSIILQKEKENENTDK